MAARRRRSRRLGNGHPALYAFHEAYHDAMYAKMLAELERILEANPKLRQRIRELTRVIHQGFADALGRASDRDHAGRKSRK